MALSPPVLAQSSTTPTPPPSSPPPEKKKKVWTEDDLGKLRGGVSVVGEAAAPAKKTPDKTAQKKESADDGILPAVEEEVAEEPPKRPPCASWSWAAAVDAVLSPQGVTLGREHWVERSYGGSICTTELGNIAALAKRVEGDYVLDDLSKVRIQAEVFTGLPVEVVASQENTGIMSLMVYKGHPYVTTGYTGVRHVASTGLTVGYTLQTVTLADPYEDRKVILDRAKDDLKDIEGGVRFVVTKR